MIPELKNIRILLVEDNPGDVVLLEEMLKRTRIFPEKYEVETAFTLNGAISKLMDKRFDMILLDLGLPDSQGLATFQMIKSHAVDMPIVVLTGLADESTGLKAVHDGAQDFLIKGKIGADLLIHCIRYAIERKRLEREIRDKLEEIERINRVMVVGRELDMQELKKEIRKLREKVVKLEKNGAAKQP